MRVNDQASTEDFEFAALGEARNYRAALRDAFAPYLRGAVLEVGAGIGQFTRELRSLGSISRLLAIEPDPRFQPGLVREVGEAGVLRGTAADLPPGEAWDAIVSINCLEHIQDDVAELARYRTLLAARGGHLCLFVPARPEIYAPLDHDFGHHRRYTLPGLQERLDGAGLDAIELRYFNLVGYFAWWFSFCLLKQRGFNPAAVRGFDRLVFPAVAWAERTLGAPPFGQSLLAVARARPGQAE